MSLQNQVTALILNVYSWCISFVRGRTLVLRKLANAERSCIVIRRPGGFDSLESLRFGPIDSTNATVSNEDKKETVATVGYNVLALPPPFVFNYQLQGLPEGLVVVHIEYFSVNYADVCIRWGLYESALKYVGWPIVPGFDFSGVVESSTSQHFTAGDEVFGFTMFGAYSSRLVVPDSQIRRIPKLRDGIQLPKEQAAGLPAVAATALHAVRIFANKR